MMIAVVIFPEILIIFNQFMPLLREIKLWLDPQVFICLKSFPKKKTKGKLEFSPSSV